ncbi:MAG TPA: hypothetical protein VIG29_05835, partial [Vicinamibacteria bacterium]
MPETGPGFVELTLVPVGTVEGDLAAPAALSASTTVTLQSFAPDFGGLFTTTAIAENRYSIAGVPPGLFLVVARDNQNGFFGESSGTMPPSGGTVEVDVTLNADTFSIPSGGQVLTDANGARFRVQRSGASTEGAGNVFSATVPGGMQLQLAVGPATATYAGGQFGFLEEQGRELVTARESLLGLSVRRKIYVPADGYFARYLEVLENETASPIAFTLTLVTNLNDGSGAMNFVEESAQWIVLDDASNADPFLIGPNVPALAFVLTGNAVSPAVAPLAPMGGVNERRLEVSYPLVLAPGERVMLMHFSVQQLSRAAAREAAVRLSSLAPEALSGLEADEIAAIGNFDVPPDGASAVEPLPPRNGRVSGRLLANDGLTVVGQSTGAASLDVKLQSDHLLFRRVQNVSGTSGGYDLDPPALPLPRTRFTLTATSTFGALSTSTTVSRDFEGETLLSRSPELALTAGSALAGSGADRVIDGLAGTYWQPSTAERWLRFEVPSRATITEIRIRRHTSAVLTGGTLTLTGASTYQQGFVFGAETELSIPLEIEDVDTVRLDFEGTTIRVDEVEIRAVASADLGHVLQDLVFADSASIDVSVRSASGELVSSFVQPKIGTFNLVETPAPSGKLFLAPIPPEAAVVLNARANVGHPFQRATSNVPPLSAGVTTPVDVLLPLGARVSGRATRDGAGIPSHPVDLIGGSLVGRVNTDANGNFAFDEVPSGSYRLRSVHSGLTLDVPIVVEAPTPLLQNLAFVTPGAIDLQVRFESADGSTIVVNGASVALHDSQSQVQTRTTVNGLASFPIVPAGAFLLRITHPTNASSVTEQSGSLSPGQTLQLSIAIPAFGTLRGGVLFGDGSTAAAGAAVELLEPGVARPPQTTPFQFTAVRAAVEVSLRARHPAAGRSHIYKEDRVTIPREGATLDVPIQLPAT